MLTLPEKIRIFVWRAAKNILPSAENLWKRKIIREPLCQLCKNGMETIFHALVSCKATKKIWKTTRFAEDLKGSSDQDVLSFLLVLNSKRSKADMELLVVILWMTWNARNRWLFKGKKDIPQILVSKAEAVMEAYQRT